MKTLHHIRHEKYEVVDYLGEVLKSFKDFVQRPDPKQEYVSQWQIDFNRYAMFCSDLVACSVIDRLPRTFNELEAIA